jgi:DNA-binding MarR family transcriptional regulator
MHSCIYNYGMAERINTKEAARIADTVASQCIGVRIRMLNRSVSRIYDEQLRPHGIKFSQMNILTAVTNHAPVQPSRIAQILCIEKSTLSRNLRVMQGNGWIESIPGDVGNSQLLRTTAKGLQLLKKAMPGWRKAQNRTKALLGDGAIKAIRGAVKRVSRSEA